MAPVRGQTAKPAICPKRPAAVFYEIRELGTDELPARQRTLHVLAQESRA